MKNIYTIIFALVLIAGNLNAQDTMYVYKSGAVVSKRAVSQIDSIIFYSAAATLPNCGTVTDIDGNVYNTITIGTQCWMTENLKTTKYRDGTSIPNVSNNTTWGSLTTGAYSDYDNTLSNSATYGKLYNWYAAIDAHKICPLGWHVPSNAEWNILEKYLDNTVDTTATGYVGTDIGGILKEIGITHWNSPNTGATDSIGFTALPGGYRDNNGTFSNIGRYGYWWSTTVYNATYSWPRGLSFVDATINRGYFFKVGGYSIRCIKD